MLIGSVALLYWKSSEIKRLRLQLGEVQSLLKSKEVKFGKSLEHFVPFTKDFPADKEKTVFLGMPIDFIAFDDNIIRFIECKTGQAQLSPKQQRIKRLVEEKKVEWHELRYE